MELQDEFDPLGVRGPGTVHTLLVEAGRVVRYIDEGSPDWRPFVFFGGLGTSVGAFALTEFARTTRERLGLRVISVERNGFGQTPFDRSLGYADAVDDVLAVLAALRLTRFAVVAFSGGGPFAAALAARAPERVLTLHLAAAAAGASAPVGGPVAPLLADAAELARDPRASWRFEAGSPVHLIPGFLDAAAEEGARALGAGRAAEALAHEWRLLGCEPLPDLMNVTAPAYLYWGTDDEVVSPAHAQAWRRALPGAVTSRRYDGEAHDVQYRHWDQILLDAAGLGERTLICREGSTALVSGRALERHLARGATLGLCAWAFTARSQAKQGVA